MTEKELKRLSRRDLLELLIEEKKTSEQAQLRLNAALRQLQQRNIVIENAGSIAEASLQLNGVFQAAQAAAEEYLSNVRKGNAVELRQEAPAEPRTDAQILEVQEQCQRIMEETRRKCLAMIQEAKREAAACFEPQNRNREQGMEQ